MKHSPETKAKISRARIAYEAKKDKKSGSHAICYLISGWKESNHGLRFGQWLSNLIQKDGRDLFYIEDEELIKLIQNEQS